MFKIDKVIQVPSTSPFRKEAVDLKILEMCEIYLKFKPLSHVEMSELPARNGIRRFHIKAAYGFRDK